MPKDRPDVVLGWGYGPTNLTSPALAAAAGALADTAMADQAVTELRIHGVSGSDASVMLEHPTALQVAGDDMTGFFRRWIPDGPGRLSVSWKLEAYSLRGRTVTRVALTWLLAPFMMYNAAHFMLPPGAPGDTPVVPGPVPHLRPGRGHRMAGALLRLLALAATVQFAGSVTTVTVSTVALQAAGRDGMLPSWMGWYGQWTVGWRVAWALISVGVVVAGLWRISATTTLDYEPRISSSSIDPHPRWPLTQAGFWKDRTLAGRQRALHCAAALAASALIVMLPAGHPLAVLWTVRVLAVAVLLVAAVLVVAPIADHHRVTLAYGGTPPDSMADRWCDEVLTAAVLTLVLAAVVSGLTDQRRGPQPGALPGLDAFLAGLLVVQVALLVALAVTVVRQAGRARAAGCYREIPPFLRGCLSPLVALTGVVLGGILAALINLGVTSLLGTPVPTGFAYLPMPSNALAVPWPIFAFGIALVGLVFGALIAQIPLFRRYRGRLRYFQARPDGAPSPVAVYYRDRTAGAGDTPDGDGPAYGRNREAIARAWAAGRIWDDVDAAAACVIGAAAAVALMLLLAAAVIVGPPGRPTVLGSWFQGLGGLVALGLVWMVLRRNKSAREGQKSERALWDMITFWPRAVHPLPPPSYAARAVPEIVDRIRLLTGHLGENSEESDATPRMPAEAGPAGLERTGRQTVPAGPVLLSGYSYGSAIASAVIAQLAPRVRREVALLTLACPVRRLYGRAFPAYFGGDQLATLAEMLDAGGRAGADGRWKNLYRRSDYIGSWVLHDPEPRSDLAYLAGHVDQPCWDPVALVPDAIPPPPPTRRYGGFWSDPRTNELGAYLVDLLERRASAGADGTAGPSEPQQDGGSASGSQRDLGSVTSSSGTAGAARGGTTGPISPSGA